MAEKTMFDIIKKQNGERFAKAIRAYDNGILIPRVWLGNQHADKFVPYVLAYKRK